MENSCLPLVYQRRFQNDNERHENIFMIHNQKADNRFNFRSDFAAPESIHLVNIRMTRALYIIYHIGAYISLVFDAYANFAIVRGLNGVAT